MLARRRRPVLIAAVTSTLVGCSAALWVAPPSAARAQEQQLPEVANARHSFEGQINSNAVFVRSGPSENFYPTQKLDRGTPVTVVGIKFNWLKIAPPKGSFSYVPKAYVQRHGDGTEGSVMNDQPANVRAGSEVNPMKSTVQTRLQPGQRVRILGEQDEYFKIEPPEGAYLYVDAKFVDPVRRIGPAAPGEIAAAEPKQDPAPADAPAPDDAVARTTTPAEGDLPVEALSTAPSTQDAGPATQDTIAAATAPTTGPAENEAPAVAAQFDELEGQFKEASGRALTEQPLDELSQGYGKLGAEQNLPRPIRRVVDARLAALKVRTEARESYLVLKKSQDELQQKQMALAAEREELQERIKQNEVKVFAAVGVLRTSSLQLGGELLYRLTDPDTGRTVVYVRGGDGTIPALMNQFVGVQGTLASDPQLNLKVITNPTGAEAVDQTKVNGAVAAQVVPPSLLPKLPITSTISQQDEAVEPQ